MNGNTKLTAIAGVLVASTLAGASSRNDLVGFGDAYRLGPEDVVEVFVWNEPDLSTSAVVRPDGFISLPLVDDVSAEGRTAEELRDDVRKRLELYVADPTVSVIVKEINSPRVTVLGEVRTPGVYTMKHQYTVLDAIAMAGGFTEYADRDVVTVLRQGPDGLERIKVELKRMIQAKKGDLLYLRPADTVYVE